MDEDEYHIYPNVLDRQAWADNIDPDQHCKMQSVQGLHLLALIQQFLDTSTASEMDLLKF